MLGRRVVQLLGDPLPLLVLEAQDAPGELVQGRLGGTMFRDVGEEDAQAIRRGADVEIEKVARPQAGHHLAPDAAARLHAFPDDAAALGIRMAQVPEACAQDPVRIRPHPVPRRLVEIGDAIGPVQREVAVADAGQDGPEPLVRIFDLCRSSLACGSVRPRRGHFSDAVRGEDTSPMAQLQDEGTTGRREYSRRAVGDVRQGDPHPIGIDSLA